MCSIRGTFLSDNVYLYQMPKKLDVFFGCSRSLKYMNTICIKFNMMIDVQQINALQKMLGSKQPIFAGSKRMNLVVDCFDPTFWVIVVLTQLLFKNDYSAWTKIIACRIITVTTQETGKIQAIVKTHFCVCVWVRKSEEINSKSSYNLYS